MKKTTIKDVAKHAGVSISTVSKVLNEKGYVGKDAYRRVKEAIEHLHYQVNASARSLKATKTNRVALIVSYISNPYLMSIAKTLEDMIRSLGSHMILLSHNENEETEKELLQIVLEQRVDGLVIIPTGSNADMIQHVIDLGIPVVIVDKKVEGISSDLIVDDNYYGSFESISYLNQLGHQRIGVIHGKLKNSVGKERLEGALDAIGEFHCCKEKSLIKDGNFSVEGGYTSTIELLFLPEPPTAIYCCNNTMTKGMIKAIREQGLKVPEDVSIISFGDAEQWELIDPPLTLMTQPLRRIGLEAALIMKNRLTLKDQVYEPKHIVIKPELRIGKSCKNVSSYLSRGV